MCLLVFNIIRRFHSKWIWFCRNSHETQPNIWLSKTIRENISISCRWVGTVVAWWSTASHRNSQQHHSRAVVCINIPRRADQHQQQLSITHPRHRWAVRGNIGNCGGQIIWRCGAINIVYQNISRECQQGECWRKNTRKKVCVVDWERKGMERLCLFLNVENKRRGGEKYYF